MEEFPEFKFSFGLPNLYELTKNNYPELFRQIKSRVAEGKWEVLGSTWTDTDCNITNGESLIRQILFGKKFIKNEFGIENDTLWLPNSFGFHWAMPQILIKSGVTKFYTSKLSSNDSTKFPYSSFWWQGIDGSKVLAHISPVGLEGQVIPESLNKNISSNVDDQTFPVLQTFGFGNNGGGVTKDNMEFAIILKSIIGLPPSQHSTVKEFFSQLKEHEDILPTWNNELYLEAHRGSYTTNSTIKKSNRASETLLYNAELLSTLLQVFGKNMKSRKYPQETLEYIWKMFLMNQSQNVLSGTSIAVVNSEADQRFQQINNGCANIITNCIGKLSSPVKKKKNEYQFTLFNTQAWSRNEYVELSFKSNEKHFIVCDEQEKAIEFQIIERSKNVQKLLCFVNDIPAFSFKRIIIRSVPKSLTTPISWNASSHGIETPFYKIRLDGKGSISSLFAKNLRRELIQKGKRGNLFILYRDAPKEYEAWNLDDEYEKHRLDVLQIKQIRILEQGPIRATIRLEFRTEHGSTLVQNMYLYHQSPRIDFSTNIRWHEKQTLLKVAFQFNLKSPSTSYEIPFGAINRTSKPHSDWEKAKYEVPALQWADMSDTKYGISLINDSKYGHDANENILRLTLLRSPHYPNPIAPNESDNTWIDQGDHSITYALYPHHGSWTKEETIRRSRELNNPILIFPNIIAESYPILIEGLKSNIIIDSIKKAEQNESMIIRLHEAHGIVTDTSPRLNFAAQAIFECDLLENDLKSCKFNKSKLALKFKPFEIKTLRIVLKQSRKSPK
jgi:alpha-mannosidase